MIADNSALLMVCRSSWDLISMWMVMPVLELTIDAPSVGFPVFFSVRVDATFRAPHGLELFEGVLKWDVWRVWCVRVLFCVGDLAVDVVWVFCV